ncbi:MAG: amidase [Microthrixaceae bacterium]
MAGEPQHAGSGLLKSLEYRAEADSYLVQRLRRAGFVVLGRTNTPEFGSTCTTEPLAYGATHNPWNTDHSSGGSSGGSAAAVAARMVPVAHASDGGGSIRIPASECGLFGLKPSRGRISRGPQAGEGWGGASTDGCVSISVRDSAAFLDLVAGWEPGDPYTAPPPSGPYLDEVGRDPGRLRIGVRTDHVFGSMTTDPECVAAAHATADLLESLGHEVVRDANPAALGEAAFMGPFLTVLSVAMSRQVAVLEELAGRPLTPDDLEPANWASGRTGAKLSGADYLAAIEAGARLRPTHGVVVERRRWQRRVRPAADADAGRAAAPARPPARDGRDGRPRVDPCRRADPVHRPVQRDRPAGDVAAAGDER